MIDLIVNVIGTAIVAAATGCAILLLGLHLPWSWSLPLTACVLGAVLLAGMLTAWFGVGALAG